MVDTVSEGQESGQQAPQGEPQQQEPQAQPAPQGEPQQQPQQPQQQQPQQTPGLVDQVQDPELKEWAEAKGWKDLDGVLKSTRNLEKMVGAPPDEVIRLPNDPGQEQVEQVMRRLGMPEKPDEYNIPDPENLPVDDQFKGWAREAFHKAGLTKTQAETLAAEWNGYAENTVQQSQEDYNAQIASQEQELKQEWGNGYDRQVRLAQHAAKDLGLTEDQLESMEQSMGYAGVMRLFAGLGKQLGEDRFVDSDGDGSPRGFSNQMTPAEAKDAYARMISDPEQTKALTDKSHPNHKQAMEKKQRLFSIIYPDQA